MADINKASDAKPSKDDDSAKVAADATAKLAADAAPQKPSDTAPKTDKDGFVPNTGADPKTFKIDGKDLTLQGGFNRNEKPDERKVFPTPDYKPGLVPKDGPGATSGQAPRSTWDTMVKDVSGTFGDAAGKVVAWKAQMSHWMTGDDWNTYGQDRSYLGRAKDVARPVDLRNQMEHKNLQSAYPPGEQSAHLPGALACPVGSEVSRTANGACNDLLDPAQGAAGTRFQYNTKPDTRYAINDPPITDAARILARTDGFKELPVLNLLGAFNLQANVHDWMDHGKHQNTSPDSFYHIPLPEDHPIRQPRALGTQWMGLDVSKTLTTGDKLDVARGQQTLTTPGGEKLVVKQDGSYQIDGKDVAPVAGADTNTIKLSDGSVVKQSHGMIVGLERNGQEGKISGQTEMLIPKLLQDGTRNAADDKAGVRTSYENTVTHWWDASEIYGSDKDTNDRLRTHADGKMKLDKDGLLPPGPQGVPDTGFNQNWNPGLEVVHTLYVREHNSIADELIKAYPKDQFSTWKDKLPEIVKPMFGDQPPAKLTDAQYDDFIYSRARLINAAEIAKIHTVDWTPVALNNKTMTESMYANYGQEKTEPFSKIFNEDELGGIWGNKLHNAGVPYEMEEDFVQSYQQMHGLVPDTIHLFDAKTDKPIGDVPMDHALQGDAHAMIKAAGFDNVLYSMQKDTAGQIAAHNDPDFMRALDIRGNVEDLTAIDILRGREKQLPRYNEYLRQMHLPPVKTFEELMPDNPKLRQEVRKVYGNDIEKVDTVVGSLAEWPGRTPQTMGFSGSTFAEFILMASRRVQSDRFYTTDFRPEIYTPEGIARVRGLGGMKDIIERNAPALKDKQNRNSAFHPLGTGPIPLNNSGIDEKPVNDIQAHLAAFDAGHKGELSLGELATGFEDIGYSAPVAYFKASMAADKFGNWKAAIGVDKVEISKIKPEAGGMYNADGNLDQTKVDALFHNKPTIKQADVDDYLKARDMGFLARKFVEGQFDSAFKIVNKDSITRDEFVGIMKGDLIRDKIAAVEKAKADAKAAKAAKH